MHLIALSLHDADSLDRDTGVEQLVNRLGHQRVEMHEDDDALAVGPHVVSDGGEDNCLAHAGWEADTNTTQTVPISLLYRSLGLMLIPTQGRHLHTLVTRAECVRAGHASHPVL